MSPLPQVNKYGMVQVMKWYVIQVRSRKETEFRRLAHLQIGPGNGDNLYIPLRKMYIRRQGKEHIEECPIYPGYVFLSTPELSPEQQNDYRRVNGVIRWLGVDGKVMALGPGDLEILQHFLRNGEVVGISQVTYDANMRIQVLAGPLMGLEGRIIRVDKRKRRAHVRLDLYHSSFEVDFSFELIQAREKDSTGNE